jgi:hypothetical protein
VYAPQHCLRPARGRAQHVELRHHPRLPRLHLPAAQRATLGAARGGAVRARPQPARDGVVDPPRAGVERGPLEVVEDVGG